jgi:hypothetical protein
MATTGLRVAATARARQGSTWVVYPPIPGSITREAAVDVAAESTRRSNRLRDAFPRVHPALERLLGKHLKRPRVLELLDAASTPTALRELGTDAVTEIMRPRAPRPAKTLPPLILTALEEQSVLIAGTGVAIGRILTSAICRHCAQDCARMRL